MVTRTRSRRRKRSLPDVKVKGKGTPIYEVLSKPEVEKIVDATFQLLRETGVAFDPDPQVLDRFSDAGCEISADHVVNYRQEPVGDYVGRLTGGRGFDVVFDTVGGENLQRSFAAARWNGAVVNIQARGQHDLGLAHLRALSLHVVFMLIPLLHDVGRERHGRILAEVAKLVDGGRLRPLVDPTGFTFERIGEAHAHAETGPVTGKVVVRR